MKHLLKFLIFISIVSCNSNQKEKEALYSVEDFTFSSNQIIQGKPFTITYTGDKELGTGFYHQLNAYKMYPEDIKFEDNKATITIADSIDFVSFIFKTDKSQDNNSNEGYLFYVVDEDKKIKPQAEAAKQLYLIREGSFYDIEGGDQEETFNEISKLLKEQPELSEEWYETHIQVSNSKGKDKVRELQKLYISEVISKKNLQLSDYEKMQKIYRASRDNKHSDSLSLIIKDKFPDSDLAKESLIAGFFKLQSFDEKAEYYNNKLANTNHPQMDYIYNQMAMYFYNDGDMEKFNSFVDKIKKPQNKSSLLNSIAWSNVEKGKDLDNSLSISKKSLEIVKDEMTLQEDKPQFYTSNQYKQNLDYTFKMYQDTYAYLLFKTGDLKEAIKTQKEVIGEGLNIEYNERYLDFLAADERYEEIYKNAKEFIAEGNSSEKIKSSFKKSHEKLEKEENYAEVLSQLEEKALNKYKTKIKSEILDNDAPNFTAVNLEGKEYTLESLKGKTVILDFWATWCGPCKASFPGMQKVVDKYKDNSDVVFLFVDTFERGKDRLEKVSSFIENEGYTFNVLVDPFNEEKSKHTIADAFGVTGIPTKAIIDKNGKLRFKDVGYSGSTDKLATKMDVMIDLIK